MNTQGSYREYARLAIRDFMKKAPEERNLLVDSVGAIPVRAMLDIGCGAGQEMLPFIEKKAAFCVGIDIGKELGKTGTNIAREAGCEDKMVFARSAGEVLPFSDGVFDVVLCRVAITLMNNQKAIAEISRVLKTGGVFLLKTHSPAFYFGMIKKRFRSLSPRQLAYPLISLAGGTFQTVTGKYPDIDFWKGREVFQTKRTLERELHKHSLEIRHHLPDSTKRTPSYLIVKT